MLLAEESASSIAFQELDLRAQVEVNNKSR